MVRARVALFLVGLTALLVVVFDNGGVKAGAGDSGTSAWGNVQVLASSSQYSFDPQLDVATDGRTLAAWFGGPVPPGTTSSGRLVNPSGPPWTGSDVVLDTGTVDGGFGAPVVLSTHGSDGPEGLQVAISGAGVAYAAWEQRRGPWMIASAIDGGAFATPHTLLPGRSRLWALVRSPAGPVAAVWLRYASSSSARANLDYALLRPDGSLGRVVTVGAWNGSIEGTLFALNDQSEFAAVDMVGKQEEGTIPPAPRVRVCNAAGRCSRAHELRFGYIPAGAYENNAIALSEDGTVTVLASFSKPPKHPAPNTPLGLWAAVRRPGGRWSTPQKLSHGGEEPKALADGERSAVAVFQHFWTPDLRFLGNRLETSTLPATGHRLTHPAVVQDLEASEPATLATNLSGDYVIAGTHRESETAGKASLLVATGGPTGLASAQSVITGEVAGQTPPAGIDRSGDVVVLWHEDTGSGGQGIFVATRHTKA
ncbi:MAG: hypothetical protein ACRDK7_03610 [Solirubrobacteraceae bacterium]